MGKSDEKYRKMGKYGTTIFGKTYIYFLLQFIIKEIIIETWHFQSNFILVITKCVTSFKLYWHLLSYKKTFEMFEFSIVFLYTYVNTIFFSLGIKTYNFITRIFTSRSLWKLKKKYFYPIHRFFFLIRSYKCWRNVLKTQKLMNYVGIL